MARWLLNEGKKHRVHAFFAKLCFIKGEFIKTYPSKKQSFLESLIATLALFGHVPKKIISDNLKPAVKKVFTETERELQESFLKFQFFYYFEATGKAYTPVITISIATEHKKIACR